MVAELGAMVMVKLMLGSNADSFCQNGSSQMLQAAPKVRARVQVVLSPHSYGPSVTGSAKRQKMGATLFSK